MLTVLNLAIKTTIFYASDFERLTIHAKLIYTLLTAAMFMVSCAENLDMEKEKAAIQAQMDKIEAAHFLKDAQQFFAANNTTFYDIRNGSFQEVNKEDRIPSTQAYLDGMEFIALEKTKNPVIELSDDGSMGSYIGAVFLKGRFHGAPVIWVVSWQSLLRKIDNEWKIISTANTEASESFVARTILDRVKGVMGNPSDSLTISAMAACQGPIGDFKTLLFSKKSEGRMEQLTNDNHMIIKHADSLLWTKNLISGALSETNNGALRSFIYAHEFHWLSLRPQDRLLSPTFEGFSEFNNVEAIKIGFVDFQGQPWSFYYAFDDLMPLGFENPAGENLMIKVHFDSWKGSNGLKILDRLSIFENEKTWNYDYSEVKINVLENTDFDQKTALIVRQM